MAERTYSDSRANEAGTGRLATIALVVVLLGVAFFSSTKLATLFSSAETYAHQLEQLDKRQETAAGLSLASATASCIVSMIPGDACTPIAEQLSNVSMVCGVVFGAILIEKYALTITGFVLFGIVVPGCCVMFCAAVLLPKRSSIRSRISALSLNLLLVCVVLWAAVPMSVFIADKIDETYVATNTAVSEVIEDASTVSNSLESEQSEDKPWYEVFTSLVSNPGTLVDAVAEKAQELYGWAQHVLSNAVEGLAVMMVTTCVIPLGTLYFALWVVRLVCRSAGVATIEHAADMPKIEMERGDASRTIRHIAS